MEHVYSNWFEKVISFLCVSVIYILMSRCCETVQAQTVYSFPNTPSSQYVLSIDTLMTIGTNFTISPVSILSNFLITNNTLYIGPTDVPYSYGVYDLSSHTYQSHGSRGNGPGEYINIYRFFPVDNDSLYIFDRTSFRVSVIHNNAFIRAYRTTYVPEELIPLTSDLLIIHAVIPKTKSTVSTLHISDRAGNILGSFDIVNIPESPSPTIYRRAIFLSPDKVLYVAHSNKYQIDVYNVDERDNTLILESIYTREPNWFHPWTKEIEGAPLEKEPQPQISDIFIDYDGRLWVLSRLKPDNWKPVIRDDDPRAIPSPTIISSVYDTYVDVLDVINRQLLVSQKIPYNRAIHIGNNCIYLKGESTNGDNLVNIYQLELTIRR